MTSVWEASHTDWLWPVPVCFILHVKVFFVRVCYTAQQAGCCLLFLWWCSDRCSCVPWLTLSAQCPRPSPRLSSIYLSTPSSLSPLPCTFISPRLLLVSSGHMINGLLEVVIISVLTCWLLLTNQVSELQLPLSCPVTRLSFKWKKDSCNKVVVLTCCTVSQCSWWT